MWLIKSSWFFASVALMFSLIYPHEKEVSRLIRRMWRTVEWAPTADACVCKMVVQPITHLT
jgi:hypothetical protein